MKKTYEAPKIIFENFSLSDSVALNCEAIVGNQSKGSCPVKGTGGINIFTDASEGCAFTPVQMGGIDDEWDGFCYHVPTEYNNLFNS